LTDSFAVFPGAQRRTDFYLFKKIIHEQYIILLAAFNLFSLFFRKKWGFHAAFVKA